MFKRLFMRMSQFFCFFFFNSTPVTLSSQLKILLSYRMLDKDIVVVIIMNMMLILFHILYKDVTISIMVVIITSNRKISTTLCINMLSYVFITVQSYALKKRRRKEIYIVNKKSIYAKAERP